MQIEIGHLLTPNIASARGIQLVREYEHHGILLVLYREPRRLSGDVWLVTTNHVVLTMSSIERVAQFALLHS